MAAYARAGGASNPMIGMLPQSVQLTQATSNCNAGPAGQVVQLYVNMGDTVHANDTLATIRVVATVPGMKAAVTIHIK